MAARARATGVEASPPGLAAALRRGEVSHALPAGIGLAAVGAVAAVVAAITGVVRDVGPAYPAWPLLALLAVAPPAVAVVAAQRGGLDTAAGVLAGSAVVAVGRLFIDAQFLVDATVVARPELMAPPSSILPLHPLGLGALLAADVLTAGSGFLALRAVPSGAEGTRGDARRQRWTVAGSAAAFVVVLGLLMRPYLSDDAYLTDRGVLDVSSIGLAGVLLLGVGLPFAAALAATARSSALGTAVLLGLALGAAGLVLPLLAAVFAVPWLHFGVGPVIALAGIAALVAVAFVPQRSTGPTSEERTVPTASADPTDPAAPGEPDVRVEVRMPRLRWLHVATGALAVLTAGFAVAAARLPLVQLPDGSVASRPAGQWLLLPAGGVLGVLGVALLVPAVARMVRPALSIAWSAVVVAATAALALPLAAADLPVDVGTGSGAVLAVLAVVGSLLVAGSSVVAGMVERETADPEPVGPWLHWPVAAAAVLAVVAFALPMVTSERYPGTALLGDLAFSSAGLLAGLLVVVAGCALAPNCRPPRAAAVLAGAATVLVVRLLELPAIVATGDAAATAGAGFWAGGAAVAVLVATAGAVVFRELRDSR